MEKYEIKVGYIYNDSFTEKEFLYAVLQYIYDSTASPSYIFDEMTISDVSRINVPIFLTSGDAVINYSRMIGYDRIVTTTTCKTKTYGNGFQNKSYNSYSKTYTDWESDAGSISGTATSGVCRDEHLIYDEYITNHKMDKNNIGALSKEDLDNYYLTQKDINFLKNDIINKVYSQNITYPGNHVKNEEYSGDVTFYDTTVTIVSLYHVDITIRDRIISFIASSNGEIEINQFGDYPTDDFDEIINYNIEIKRQRNEATKGVRTAFKCSIISTLIFFVLFLILGLKLDNNILKILSFVGLVVGLVITLKINHDVKTISKPYYQQIREHTMKVYQKLQGAKEEGYESFLNKLK